MRSKSSGMSGQFAARMPNCSDRYRLVGVLPLRDTPTRMTSALSRSREEAPSSCARAKLMASMRCVYPFASRVLCERPMVWVDLEPNSASSGSRKFWKKSSTSASALRTVSRISAFTSVVKTTGRKLAGRAVPSMRSTTASAFATESTKGTVSWLKSMPSNCVSRLWPSISTVIPVPSETKNTVRRRSGMRGGREGGKRLRRWDAVCKIAVSTRSFNLDEGQVMAGLKYVVNFDRVGMADVEQVGGKNASLGEMISRLSQAGIRVPGGFATTADAFREFLAQGGLAARIETRLKGLDAEDVDALARCGEEIRGWIEAAEFPKRLQTEIAQAYRGLTGGDEGVSVAVRSSATAEDLPDASFAGQQETFLNIRGLPNVMSALKRVFASLYNDRAISYRCHRGYAHAAVALSAGVQRMARSDLGASGVLFTMDTESGFRDVVFITASWGLGEMVVQGAVNPDEFYVHKPMLRSGKFPVIRRSLGAKTQKMVFGDQATAGRSVKTLDNTEADRSRFCLSDADVIELARFAVKIEEHYGRPMDIEWAKDGADGKLYILQARPETVNSRKSADGQERFLLRQKSEVMASGRAIGHKIGAGAARVVKDASEMARIKAGDVIVTDMTDPNWEPVMKRAAAIVTNRGGRTCHAAIIARELGIPAVVGCGDATAKLKDGDVCTVSCAEGDTGNIYRGKLEFEVTSRDYGEMPDCPVKITMNIGNPNLAFDFQALPNAGVGLARLEFVINNMIGVHPKAVLDYPGLS